MEKQEERALPRGGDGDLGRAPRQRGGGIRRRLAQHRQGNVASRDADWFGQVHRGRPMGMLPLPCTSTAVAGTPGGRWKNKARAERSGAGSLAGSGHGTSKTAARHGKNRDIMDDGQSDFAGVEPAEGDDDIASAEAGIDFRLQEFAVGGVGAQHRGVGGGVGGVEESRGALDDGLAPRAGGDVALWRRGPRRRSG